MPAADEESGVLRGEFENLWPLQLLDMRDEEMVDTLFRLLRKVPQVRAGSPPEKNARVGHDLCLSRQRDPWSIHVFA